MRLAAILVAVATLPAAASAQRADALFAGGELRLRPGEGRAGAVRTELALPHGLVATDGTALVARLGVVLPAAGSRAAFPGSLGFRAAPLAGAIRPLFGVDIGGYLVDGDPVDRSHLQWSWTGRALVGARAELAGAVALQLYLDASWIQAPQDRAARGNLHSGVGAGAELTFAFAPRLRLVDMLLRGAGAPEAF